MNKETSLTNEIRLALADVPGLALWRNSIGWDSRTKVYYGIGGKGGSDLIGIYGSKFVALEIKMPGGIRSEEQENFVKVIRGLGGLAGFATSVKEARAIINGEK